MWKPLNRLRLAEGAMFVGPFIVLAVLYVYARVGRGQRSLNETALLLAIFVLLAINMVCVCML